MSNFWQGFEKQASWVSEVRATSKAIAKPIEKKLSPLAARATANITKPNYASIKDYAPTTKPKKSLF